MKHHIDLQDDSCPMMQRPYRRGTQARKFVSEELENILDASVIEPAQNQWALPVVMAPKADGSYMFCVEYRRLNAITIRDTYPLPRIDDSIDSLGEPKVFSTIDVNWEYIEMPVAETECNKAVFTSPLGSYRFRRMNFGLRNGRATFQRTFDITFN